MAFALLNDTALNSIFRYTNHVKIHFSRVHIKNITTEYLVLNFWWFPFEIYFANTSNENNGCSFIFQMRSIIKQLLRSVWVQINVPDSD